MRHNPGLLATNQEMQQVVAGEQPCTPQQPLHVLSAGLTDHVAVLYYVSRFCAGVRSHLLQVPALVQSQLADQADELVRVLTRQWAVHERMTAAPASSSTAESRRASAGGSSGSSAQASRHVPAAVQRVAAEPVGVRGSCISSAGVTARRISPAPVAAACTPEAQGFMAGASSNSSSNRTADCCRYVRGEECKQAANAHANNTAFVGTSAASDETNSSTSWRDVDHSAATAADLLSMCSQPGLAPPSQQLRDLQLAVALAASGHSIQRAVDSYIEAAIPLLLHGSITGNGTLASDSLLFATAACTARVLVAGVVAGSYSASELELHLLGKIKDQGGQGSAVPAAREGAQGSWQTMHQDNLDVQQLQQQQLCQLLASAVLHTFLTDNSQLLLVWRRSGQAAIGAGRGIPYFNKLPYMLMKIARADGPVWLLCHMRKWLQAATLSVHQVMSRG